LEYGKADVEAKQNSRVTALLLASQHCVWEWFNTWCKKARRMWKRNRTILDSLSSTNPISGNESHNLTVNVPRSCRRVLNLL
jgi:hypothetical protein